MKNLFLILFFLQFSVLNAQTTSDLSQIKWVNEADGLTQLYVNNCATDNNGFVWIATQLGLFRYNWREATLVQNNTYPNLNKQRISKLYKNPTTGTLYFSTSPEGKGYSIKDNEIRQLNENEGIFLQNDVFLNATHPLYPAIVKYYKIQKKRIEDSSLSTLVLTDSFFYMLFSNTVVILDKHGNTKVIPYKGTENATFFNCDGSIFVIDKEKIGLITRDALDFNKVTADAIVLDYIQTKKTGATYISTIYFNKTTYINHKNNIYKMVYKDNKIAAEFITNSPTYEESAFSYSEENKVFFFFSSYQGMAIVKSNTFNTIYSQPNRFDFSDYAIVKKKENWYNYNGWIYNTTTKALKNRTITTNGRNMRFLLEDNNNYYYESKYNELVSIIDLKTKLPFKTNEDFKSLTSYTYLNNRLWLSYEKKIACLVNNQFVFDTLFNKAFKSSQSINAINSIDGNLIIATTNGVYLHKPFSKSAKYIKGLENGNARYIKLIDKSKFWVGCYGEGLYLVHNNKSHKVVDSTIDIATAHAIEEDQYGNLWISTNNGLLTVSKQKAISNTLKKIPIESYVFTTNDGLPTDEFNGGGTFPSLKDTDGTIGFPSMKGFVWFDPINVKKQLFTGGIIIDELLVNKSKMLPLAKDTYKISSDAKIITIKFDYGYAGNLQNLMRFYKFENQTAWTEIKGNTIVIPRYKKGSHRLQIKIKTHGFEDKDDVVKVVTLDFEPRFYETIGFLILVTISILLLIFFSYLFGNYYRQKRERNLEKIINQNNIDLRVSNETIKKTFAIVSHDLKGPFNSILGFSSYILKNYDDITSEELKKYVKAIDSSANKNYQLTLQLLSWSLKQQNGITINKQLYDLNDIIDKSISVLTPLANQKSIEITANSELDTHAMGYFDIDIIFNIMYNIISNAIKYSPQKSTITIKSYADSSTMYIETQDAGQGMDGQLLATLNSKNTPKDSVFVTEDNTYLGGYGLSYAKELVALYDGTLTFKSELNKGTTVIFSFPLENNQTNG